MKKIQEVLKNKSGQGVPMILAVVLCCLILACVTFEYMRLMIVAQGVRDSVQSAIVDVATASSTFSQFSLSVATSAQSDSSGRFSPRFAV